MGGLDFMLCRNTKLLLDLKLYMCTFCIVSSAEPLSNSPPDTTEIPSNLFMIVNLVSHFYRLSVC